MNQANDRVRIALVGLRGRGRDHISGFGRMPGAEIAALCDIDEPLLATRLDGVEKLTGKRPAAFTDFRKLLDDKSIDAVAIATQNHWHSLQTIWACQAGKDVYVEKPGSHNAFESRQLVAAARKYNRIVQHGTQTRSAPAVQEGMAKLREGVIGDVYMARGLCFNWRDTIGRAKPEPVPPGVHYDLWIGPAPVKPFTKNRFHYNWHWQWDYGNGDIGNQGVHEMDVARWGLGVTYPTKVSATGGHFMFDDDQETPNTITAMFEFDEGGRKKMLVFEVRHWISNQEGVVGASGKGAVGNIFYGSKGYMVRERMGYKTFLGKEQEPGPAAGPSRDNHMQNFVQAVRSRRREDLNAEIEEGAITCTLIHLANISYRLGRTIRFDPKTLACVGDAEANRMLRRTYRAPYVVPEKV
ncbi:MAG TPA: Gfo/Idh/MocA family oxidoreductase [Bryobacteraceae bacterium]|nr:Gfo/Idh/MocA family oxidoreductase [Bryobacteraceae bacterium]